MATTVDIHLIVALNTTTDLWPMDLIANPTHCLKFRYQETLPADMPYRTYDVDEKFNMLDGIGLADIVDNLPEVKMRRQEQI